MSFFLASVPAGTQLYHGTYTTETVKGYEWLAFEPEHAMIFAYPRGPVEHTPVNDASTGEKEDSDLSVGLWEETMRRRQLSHRALVESVHDEKVPPHQEPLYARQLYLSKARASASRDDVAPLQSSALFSRPSREEQQPLERQKLGSDAKPGYLHTYSPKHDLRLLYIDGLSAGKTSNGTLDSQDMVLLNMSSSDLHGPMGGDYERAKRMCNLISTLWQDKIDGVIRMEGGFEIILCDFEKHLRKTDVLAVTTHERSNGSLSGWSYMKAITERYDGIGGERITLDYDDFVSVFAYPDIGGLFNNDVQSDYAMPRLQPPENVSAEQLCRIKEDVTKLILRKNWDTKMTTTNWQAVADNIMKRYSKPLHHLHTSTQLREDKVLFQEYLAKLLHPFFDHPARNATLETQRCVSQHVPVPDFNETLAHRTVYSIAHHMCSVLFTSLHTVAASASQALSTSDHALELIDDLVDYLQWTTWKRCGPCSDEEVCYIPIWPMGNHEDHLRPRCRKEEDARGRLDYWGRYW